MRARCETSDIIVINEQNMINPSPLRYPGGKNRLSKFIGLVIQNLNLKNCTYVEPFAGGAGIALSLLLDGVVDNIIINDYDKAIYSFWKAVKNDTSALIKKISETPVDISEWHKQHTIYEFSTSYSVELAFATLFLNRTNHSGILNAGPIGGYSQSGNWKLDVRFNKESLIEKIDKISSKKRCIRVYNQDIFVFLNKYTRQLDNNTFYYFDPPYYNKGQKLYKNFLSPKDHKRIRDIILSNIPSPWIMTYDDVPEIASLYSDCKIRRYDLTYSAANKGTASEIMIFSNSIVCPTTEQLRNEKITINLRG